MEAKIQKKNEMQDKLCMEFIFIKGVTTQSHIVTPLLLESHFTSLMISIPMWIASSFIGINL